MNILQEIIIFTAFMAGFMTITMFQLILGELLGISSEQIFFQITNLTGVIFVLNSVLGGIITADLIDEKDSLCIKS